MQAAAVRAAIVAAGHLGRLHLHMREALGTERGGRLTHTFPAEGPHLSPACPRSIPIRVSHTALARKYRPRRFAEVATQEHVSETLRRAVSTGRVGHAYLFCGPRGVGKTTLARVLAMALNCPERGDEGEPCGACESCSLIWSGRTSLDVVEIDAASNRGVEDARSLRERAMYAPSDEHRFKIYIVDEAHMLTREAWNALLKILEEPPPRVMFIFATTEPQRIQQSASPILSRCQRFDFRRLGVADIVARLEQVIESEGARASPDALRIIARKADGGMRDALSLLDQILAFTGGVVTPRSVREVLGVVEEDRFVELFDIIHGHRHREIFAFVEALVDEGYDLVEFYHGLVEGLRLLLCVRLDGGGAVDAEREHQAALEARARDFDAADLVRMLAMAADLESQGSLKRVSQPRVLIELLLLRLSHLDRTVRIEDLLDSLGGAPRPPATNEPAASGGPEPASRPPTGAKRRTASRAPRREDGDSGRAPSADQAPPDPTARRELDPTAAATPPATPREPKAPKPEPPSTSSAINPVAAFERLLGMGGGPSGLRGLRSLLHGAAHERVGERGLRLTVPPGPALDRLSQPGGTRALADALREVLGYRPSIDVEEGRSEESAGPRAVTSQQVRKERLEELVEREPLLARAVEEFDLQLLD